MHLTFLSDPDWPSHDLQIFWGATTMLAPDICLHWSSVSGAAKSPHQTFNPRDPNLQPHQFDYYTRAAMLGAFGISQKLPDLPAWVAQRLTHHVDVYKQHVRRFVRAADLYHLTEQPRRSGDGDRWCAFQYSLAESAEHLLFVFRLPDARSQRTIRLKNLEPNHIYQIEGFEEEHFPLTSGHNLMEHGISFALREEESLCSDLLIGLVSNVDSELRIAFL